MQNSAAANFAEQHGERVVEFVHYAFLQRDDGIVGYVDLFGADFRAAFGDVAQAEAQFILIVWCAKLRQADASLSTRCERKSAVRQNSHAWSDRAARGKHPGKGNIRCTCGIPVRDPHRADTFSTRRRLLAGTRESSC